MCASLEVIVRVDETRQQHPSLELDDQRTRADERLDLGVRSDGKYSIAKDRVDSSRRPPTAQYLIAALSRQLMARSGPVIVMWRH